MMKISYTHVWLATLLCLLISGCAASGGKPKPTAHPRTADIVTEPIPPPPENSTKDDSHEDAYEDPEASGDHHGTLNSRSLRSARDADDDGIADDVDQCPDGPEDFDSYQDDDGCPDPDNDQDGIPDSSDRCMLDPETLNGFQDADGCPDDAP